MSGWYALVVDARKSFVVVDIDDNDEQDAFWHMKPSLGIKEKIPLEKTIYPKFHLHVRKRNNDHNNKGNQNVLEIDVNFPTFDQFQNMITLNFSWLTFNFQRKN